jgi:hypothetical protein
MVLTSQNCIHEGIKNRLNSQTSCYHNLLHSQLLSKNVKIEMYKIIVLPVVLYVCETWSLMLEEEHRLTVPKIGVCIFGSILDLKG